MSVNNYLSIIHGISAAILSITMYNNPWSIHKRSQVVAWSAKYLKLHWLIQVGADIPLPVNIMEFNPSGTIRHCLSQGGIKVSILNPAGVYINYSILSICHF